MSERFVGPIASGSPRAPRDPSWRPRALRAVLELDATAGSEDVVLDRLCSAYRLAPFERDLLVLIGLPDEHEAFAELARTLHPLGEPLLSIGALAGALGLDAVGRAHLRAAIDTGPLVRSGIVSSAGPAPLPERGIRLADGLWAVIRGGDRWPLGIQPIPLASATSESVPADQLANVVGDGARIVVVSSGRGGAADDVAVRTGRGLETIGRRPVLFAPSSLEHPSASALGCHLVARDAVPVFVGSGARELIAGHPAPVVVCVADGAEVVLDDRPAIEVVVPHRTLGDDQSMWQALAPELNGDAARLAGLLRIDGLRAHRAVADARLAAHADGRPVGIGEIVHRARRRTDARLPASVRRSTPDVARDRLVTTPDNARLLGSLVDRMRGQVRVLHEWGFGEVGGARGARALFSGPPGTGKTLSARILAAELGLDLLTVDLSALVSKWIGETEKNIAEVFDAAERCQAVLFFDEADAIFGRRTDGGDAQSRWANLETAYLLSRIDVFEGLVALATNLRGHIDEAFVRRLDVIVEFDEPGPAERERIWRAHLPGRAPIGDDVDVVQLAELYPVTGGVIRNAALTAAFDAAERDGRITQSTLVDAVRREYQKSGRSFPGAPRNLVPVTGGA